MAVRFGRPPDPDVALVILFALRLQGRLFLDRKGFRIRAIAADDELHCAVGPRNLSPKLPRATVDAASAARLLQRRAGEHLALGSPLVRPRVAAVRSVRRRATLAMVTDAQPLTVVRAVPDQIDAIERAIFREAQAILQDLTRELDAHVGALVAERFAPIDRNEARGFMADFRRASWL